jgi:hypothetical protein
MMANLMKKIAAKDQRGTLKLDKANYGFIDN